MYVESIPAQRRPKRLTEKCLEFPICGERNWTVRNKLRISAITNTHKFAYGEVLGEREGDADGISVLQKKEMIVSKCTLSNHITSERT